MRRAGLDYHEWCDVQEYPGWQDFVMTVKPTRLLAFSTRGRKIYSEHRFATGDALIFGPETRGLPNEILESLPESRLLRLPMLSHGRSLNLSNSVAVALYEAWRQLGFITGQMRDP